VSGTTEHKQVTGLKQYARQTLQQYTNGATLHGMRSKQQRVVQAIHSTATTGNPDLPSTPRQAVGPQMLYMQNLTRIVLLTIESLQQRGLIPPRSLLIPQLRKSMGMAEAAIVAQNTCELYSIPSRHRARLQNGTPFATCDQNATLTVLA
jgi:hypothetical protein